MTRISTHNGDKGNAHSEYLTYLAETGFVGFLIFSILVVYSIYLAMKLLRLALTLDEKMAVLYLSSLAVLVRIDLKNKSAIPNTHENV